MSFQKRLENFKCENCGKKVKGDGFTNHCPFCLWSKHLDNFPGDRSAECGGLMKPIGFVTKNGVKKIEFVCEKCTHTFSCKVSPQDSIEAMIHLTESLVKKSFF